MSRNAIFTFSLLGISFFVTLGFLISSFDGFADRSPQYVKFKQEVDWPANYNRNQNAPIFTEVINIALLQI